ncbi:MAG: hypothetical protein ACXVPQ_08265, partial [Bacteroidia bacterium]
MRRIFFYILFFISGFHLFSQHTNYDSVLKTFKTPLEKYEYVHKELKRSGVLGASISLELSRKKLEYAMDLGDTVKVAGAYNDVGNQYLDLSDYSAALNYYLKASKFYGYKKDSVGIAMEYENISLIYSSKEDYHTAKKFMKMAVRLQEKYSRKENYYSTLGNLGDVYRNLKMIDSAFYYYNIVIRNTKDSSELAILYNNIGLYYLENNSLDSAIVFLKLSNYIDKRLGNKMNFAISEGNLADCYCKRGDIKKGLNEYRFALTLSRQLKNPELIMSSCGAMADVFAAQKQFDSAHHYLEIYTNINDSLHNTTAELQMADLRSGFDRENHEKELKIQELESEKKEQDSRNIINSFIVASLFLVTVIGFAIYRYKAKQRSYDELKLLNNEVTTQKTLVEEKQKEIVDSITYARRIQRPLLAREEGIREQFGDCFIIFKPKDIVSGDFYWSTVSSDLGVRGSEGSSINSIPGAEPRTQSYYLAVCDSTGHGVPGAFMSLLNTGFLSEAIKEKHIEHPDEIFNYVRERLVESISDDGQKDGFDGILLCRNGESGKLIYS